MAAWLKMNRNKSGWYSFLMPARSTERSNLTLHVYKRASNDWVFGANETPWSFHPHKDVVSAGFESRREAVQFAADYAQKLARGIAA